jgi:hypothetical protein
MGSAKIYPMRQQIFILLTVSKVFVVVVVVHSVVREMSVSVVVSVTVQVTVVPSYSVIVWKYYGPSERCSAAIFSRHFLPLSC